MVLNVGRLENSCLARFLHLADEMLLAHALLQGRHDELFTTRGSRRHADGSVLLACLIFEFFLYTSFCSIFGLPGQ
jgi:hypothetical protein